MVSSMYKILCGGSKSLTSLQAHAIACMIAIVTIMHACTTIHARLPLPCMITWCLRSEGSYQEAVILRSGL